MKKKNLFRLVVLIGSLPWLHLLGVQIGFSYACWFLIIYSILNLAYHYLPQDEKDDENIYKHHNFNN
jgi:hypothetical protein